MLLNLHIRDFAIVPSLAQEFGPGFTAISGETGAGKSILVGALDLLLGARSDSSWVSSGAGRAELNAEFSVAHNPEARDWLREHDLQDGDTCLLRRSIQAGGRSRAWVNGTPVTIQQLAELGDLLVELHGQNEHVRLTGRRRQLELLDSSSDYPELLAATREACERWRDAQQHYARLEQAAGLSPNELDFLRFQLRELQQHALPAGQVADLEREHRLLAASGALLQALGESEQMLDEDEQGALTLLHRAGSALGRFRALDPAIDAACRLLEEAAINGQEALAGLAAARDRVDLSPERLEEVSRALSALGDLSRKHAVPMEELAPLRDELAARIEEAADFEGRRDGLAKQVEKSLAQYRQAAASLSRARLDHAAGLARRVQDLMGELGMQGGRFEIGLDHDPSGEPSAGGDDRIEIRVSANPGHPPAPLARIASGGELSRISLALKVATAGAAGKTHVFDEIDAGVGGETANAVGRLLQQVAAGGQALCVTHLAQVAARADHQLRVTKEAASDTTTVDAQMLELPDRVEEIARMLGGRLSAQSRAHAQEMLEAARGAVH